MKVTHAQLRDRAQIASMDIHAKRLLVYRLSGKGYCIRAEFSEEKDTLAEGLTAREAMNYLDGLIEGATREGMYREGFAA